MKSFFQITVLILAVVMQVRVPAQAQWGQGRSGGTWTTRSFEHSPGMALSQTQVDANLPSQITKKERSFRFGGRSGYYKQEGKDYINTYIDLNGRAHTTVTRVNETNSYTYFTPQYNYVGVVDGKSKAKAGTVDDSRPPRTSKGRR